MSHLPDPNSTWCSADERASRMRLWNFLKYPDASLGLLFFSSFYGLSDPLLNFGSGIRFKTEPRASGVSAMTHPVLT
jgi:hypothetical protein